MPTNDIGNKEIISEEKINLDKYQDQEGLTVSKMNFSLWLLTYKNAIKNITIGVLVLVIVLEAFAYFKTFGEYLIAGQKIDTARLNAQLKNNFPEQKVLDQLSALDLQTSAVRVFTYDSGRKDFMAEVKNPNKDYWAEFDYYFTDGTDKFGPVHNFVLPNDDKYLFLLGQTPKSGNSVKLVFENFKWNRLDPHKFSDWESYKSEHLNFLIDNKKFTPAYSSSLSEKLKLSAVEFDIVNQSPYNYYNLTFDVLLYYRGEMISIGQFLVDNFDSRENKHINITWPEQIVYADNFEVVPEINILQDNVNYVK